MSFDIVQSGVHQNVEINIIIMMITLVFSRTNKYTDLQKFGVSDF